MARQRIRGWFILPWFLFAFLAGLAVGQYQLRLEILRQYEARLAEADVRQEVAGRALMLATDNKFQAASLRVEAIRRMKKEKE